MAAHFHSLHIVAVVAVLGNGGGIQRLGKAGPTATGIEFIARAEQRLAADHVHIQAGRKQVIVFMAEGAFGAVLLGDAVLLGA